MKVAVITAGHGGKDNGAVAKDGTTEASIAVEMRRIIQYYLDKKGVKVITDGYGKNNDTLVNAIKLIPKGDVAVEIHTNAFSSPSAKGVEALAQPKDKKLCQELCKAVSQVMGIPVRGSECGFKNEGSGQHSRLGYVRNGGIILELFFISNPSELETFNNKKWLIGRAIADVIGEHLGVAEMGEFTC